MPSVRFWHGIFFINVMQQVHGSLQPLDSRQLLAFSTLARTRNFTLAGKELFLSQSAISHALKVLEGDLGCRLVDRLGKKVHLTPAGEHLLHHAEKILADMGTARESLRRLNEWGKGRLRVAVSGYIHHCLVPAVLADFQAEFPDWPVTVRPADTRQCVEMLRQHQVDLAVVIAPSSAEPVEVVPLFSDELAWIVSPNHAWAHAGSVSAGEIPGQKFVLDTAESYAFRLLQKHLERDSLRLNILLELGSLQAVKETVRLGLGITALAPWTVRKELAEKTLVALPLGRRKLRRNWCILRSLDRKPPLAEETFVKYCQAAVKQLSGVE